MSESVLRACSIGKVFRPTGLFRAMGKEKHAVNDVSFDLHAGETLAIVGESGSGKSTTARLVMRLLDCSYGRIFWQEHDVTHVGARALRPLRRHIQMVFQDPYASLNPRMKIWESVAEGLRVHEPGLSRRQRRDKVAEILKLCGLDESAMDRYPHQFSGGQRQRIGIARAIVVEPRVLVLDEPVSALDVSVQAQILNLLKDIQGKRRLAYLFISHDLSVVRHVADRIAVMFAGRIVEHGRAADVFASPRHPYTEALLLARPIAHPSDRSHILTPPGAEEGVAESGCAFRLRCAYVREDCATFDNRLRNDSVACLYPLRQS